MTFADSLKELDIPLEERRRQELDYAIEKKVGTIKDTIKSEATEAIKNQQYSLEGFICKFERTYRWQFVECWNDDLETAKMSDKHDLYKKKPAIIRIDKVRYYKNKPHEPEFIKWEPYNIGSYEGYKATQCEYVDLTEEDLGRLCSKVEEMIAFLGFSDYSVSFVPKHFYYYSMNKKSLFGLASYKSVYDAGIGKVLHIKIGLLKK